MVIGKNMKFMMSCVVLWLLFVSIPSFAGQSHIIDTKQEDIGEFKHYPWISYLDKGPIGWISDPNNSDISKGYAYRVLILTSEIYNSLLFEKVTNGPEGCCMKVESIRRLDRNIFKDKFNLTGEFSGLKFIKWNSVESFDFSIHDRQFRLSNLNMNKVKIEEITSN